MNLDHLRYFMEAARFQHVGKAAQAAHISPSAVSAAISTLEEQLGVPLFDRVGKTIVITSAGQLLSEEARVLLDQVQVVKQRISGATHKLQGHFRLGSSHFLATNYLTESWSKLQNNFVDLTGEVSSLPTVSVINDVVSGALDAGLCISPLRHPELAAHEVYGGQLVVAVRKGHPLTKNNSKKALKELSHYPAILHKGRPGVDVCEFHPVFEQYEIRPSVSFFFDSDDCAVKKLTLSDGWALLPDLVVEHHSDVLEQISLPKDWNAPYNVSLICRRERMNSIMTQVLKDDLADMFKRKRKH